MEAEGMEMEREMMNEARRFVSVSLGGSKSEWRVESLDPT